eukprot:scaffold795_cov375-Prasinococcus_capsulatus_cf.AAC.18
MPRLALQQRPVPAMLLRQCAPRRAALPACRPASARATPRATPPRGPASGGRGNDTDTCRKTRAAATTRCPASLVTLALGGGGRGGCFGTRGPVGVQARSS